MGVVLKFVIEKKIGRSTHVPEAAKTKAMNATNTPFSPHAPHTDSNRAFSLYWMAVLEGGS